MRVGVDGYTAAEFDGAAQQRHRRTDVAVELMAEIDGPEPVVDRL